MPNFLQRAFGHKTETRNMLDNPAVPLASGAWQFLVDGSRHSSAGEVVNQSTAIQNAVVFSVVKILSESVGALPLRLLKVDATGRSVDALNPIHRLISAQPNPETVAAVFLESLLFSLAMNGNAYAQVQRNVAGQPVALWNLLPHKVCPIRQPNGDLAYKCDTNSDDAGDANWKVYKAADIIHVKTMGLNAIVGINPVEAQRQAIGASIAMTRHSSRLFANFATPQLALINNDPLPMSPESRTQARQDWEFLQSGDNQHRIAILDNGFDIKQLSLTNEQSQFLESREYTRSEICALWRVPEFKVGGSSKMTRANLEQEAISFVTETLKPYTTKICQELASKLLPVPSVGVSYEISFDFSELLKGDAASQAAYWTSAINSGWMSPSEVRHVQGLNPAPVEAGLTQFRVPVNYCNSAILVNQVEPEAAPMPTPIEDDQPVTPQERQALKQYGAAYSRLMVDAVRRVTSGEPATRALGALLESIQDSVSTTVGVEPDSTRLVDYLTRLESRAAKWSSEAAEYIAQDELRKAIKAFVFGAHEDRAKVVLSGE